MGNERQKKRKISTVEETNVTEHVGKEMEVLWAILFTRDP